MEYIYAALLLHKTGKDISEANVKKVLDAAGVKVDDARVKALIAALDGVNIEDALKTAITVPTASSAPVEHTVEKKEDKEEVKEEAVAAGLGALFG